MSMALHPPPTTLGPINRLMAGWRSLPEDCDECMFLLRATDKFGVAMFGDQWTCEERSIVLPPELPDALDPRLSGGLLGFSEDWGAKPAQWFDPPTRDMLVRANELLLVHHPELMRRAQLNGLARFYMPIRFTFDEWRLAQAAAQRERAEAVAGLRRWHLVQLAIKASCMRGELETRLRPCEGGEYSGALPRHFWRTEDFATRFVTWRMHPTRPFDRHAPLEEQQWIFMTVRSVECAERRLRQARTGVEEGTPARAYESEFMRCMRHTIDALGITADNMPKKALVELEIPKHWRGATDLSLNDIKGMASFIRSEAGRGGRRPKKG